MRVKYEEEATDDHDVAQHYSIDAMAPVTIGATGP